MVTKVGHVAYQSVYVVYQDKHNDTLPKPLALFNCAQLAETCWCPQVTPDGPYEDPEKNLYLDHQQSPNITTFRVK